MNGAADVPTIPISEAISNVTLPWETLPQELPQFVTGCAQSVGMVRDHNEDALFTLTTNLMSDQSNIPVGLYVIADGMGGHKHGEIASNLAVRTIGKGVSGKIFKSLLDPNPSTPSESIQEILKNSLEEAHQVILKHAEGGGTTVTALLILNEQMTIAHIGDSRAYIFSPDNHRKVLTRDHSLVMRMMELGQITAAEAAIHPQRNVLYRALGQGEPSPPDVTTLPLPDSGSILLCSDGLWGVVSEDLIAKTISSAPSPQAACQRLIDAANDAGGPDNISAILIQLPDNRTNGPAPE